MFLVDDGSTDDTAQLAKSMGAFVVVHANNLGQGWALLTSFKAALLESSDVIVEMDADGQHNPAEIPKYIEEMNRSNADIVVGSRILGAIIPMTFF
jgi:glycosyltransferase involved in cell wall biosynthesis